MSQKGNSIRDLTFIEKLDVKEEESFIECKRAKMKKNYRLIIDTCESNVPEPRKISGIEEDELEIIDMACRLAKEKKKKKKKNKTKNVETMSAILEKEKKIETSTLVRHDVFNCVRKKPQHFCTVSKWRALGGKKSVGLRPKRLQRSYEPTMSGLNKTTKSTSLHTTTFLNTSSVGCLPLTKNQKLPNIAGMGKHITFTEIIAEGCLDMIIPFLNFEEALRLSSICRIWYVLTQREPTNGQSDFSGHNHAKHNNVCHPPLSISDSLVTKGKLNDPESGKNEAMIAMNAKNGKESNDFQRGSRIVMCPAPEPIYTPNQLQPSRQEIKQERSSNDKSYLKCSSFNDNTNTDTDTNTEIGYFQEPVQYIYQKQDPIHKRRRFQPTQQNFFVDNKITEKRLPRKPVRYYDTKPEPIFKPKQLQLTKQKTKYERNNVPRLYHNFSYNNTLKPCKLSIRNEPTYDKHSYVDYSRLTNSMIPKKFDVKGDRLETISIVANGVKEMDEFQCRFGIPMYPAPRPIHAPNQQPPRQEIKQTRRKSFVKSGFSSNNTNTEIGYFRESEQVFKSKNLQPAKQKVMYERYNIERSCINFISADDKPKQIQPVQQNMKCIGKRFDINSYNNIIFQPCKQRKTKDKQRKTKERIYLDHSYIDFSRLDDSTVTDYSDIKGDKLESIIEGKGAKTKGDVTIDNDVVSVEFDQMPTKRRGNNCLYFPHKLMIMLHDNPNPEIVTWLPHGRCFTINDPTRFMHEVHPLYFKTTLYKTFKRMLNLWGFKRLSSRIDNGAYYHQFFLRGMPNLVCKMVLTKKKNGVRPWPNP